MCGLRAVTSAVDSSSSRRARSTLAVMPFTLAVDWEGDQWTFFKPPHSDLRTLYGFDTQELNVWRPLVELTRRRHLKFREELERRASPAAADAYPSALSVMSAGV